MTLSTSALAAEGGSFPTYSPTDDWDYSYDDWDGERAATELSKNRPEGGENQSQGSSAASDLPVPDLTGGRDEFDSQTKIRFHIVGKNSESCLRRTASGYCRKAPKYTR